MTDQRRLASTPTVSADYTDDYYEGYHLGLPYTYEEPHWANFFGGIADRLIALFAPETSYDAGCAKGFLVRAMAERGVDARGGDISAHAVEGAPPGLAERLEVKDLTEPFTEKYDLVTCIEVLEHMSSDDAQVAIKNLCDATDLIILSTTPEDFTEPTHINVRQPADWARDFARYGFFRRTNVDASFVSPWAVAFARSKATVVEMVGAYESLLAPLNREVVDKRRALLEAQRDINEARSPVNAAVADALRQRDQISAERDEIAKHRDALVADRDAVAADRDRLRVELHNLGQADLQAERMNRLAMADELVGLKAELAQVKIQSEYSVVEAGREAVRLRDVLAGTESELSAAQHELAEARAVVAAMSSSFTWRIGRLAMTPVRLARLPKRILRALARRAAGVLRR